MNNLRALSEPDGFESHLRLQTSRFKSVDFNLRLFPGVPDLGTFGNNWKKSLF
jgi:hypothetical protein